jgi:hypothetical protein
MEKYYFTFGCGMPFEGYAQVVYANGYNEAREKMVSVYGTVWAFQYSEEDWKRNKFKEILINAVIK